MVVRNAPYEGAAPLRESAGGRLEIRPGTVLGAMAAALASAGLVYWISAAGDSTLGGARALRDEPATAPAHAPVHADAGEVIRAYEKLQQIYADAGAVEVARSARSCAQALSIHPQSLDFCVAFNLLAADIAPGAAPADADQQLALVRAALPPGVDAAGRLAQLRALTRQASLQIPAGPTAPSQLARGGPAKPDGAQERVAAKTAPHSVKAASARTASTKAAVTKAAAACRRRAPAAPRTVCGSASLRTADARLRATYQRAAAAGVSPSRLGREQRWFRRAVQDAAPDRAAVARLYAKRTRQLQSQAKRAGG